MKKEHIRLKLCKTAIALLHDPMLQEIYGGNSLALFNSKPGYNCGGTRDTATVPTFIAPSICARCTDAEAPLPDERHTASKI